MAEDRNGKTYSFDVCSQCKTMCCQGANPPLTDNRKKILTDYLQKQKKPTANLFIKEDYAHPAVDAQEYCALYNKQTGKCSVHPVKPETCVAGPITFDINLKTGKVEWFLKKGTICAFAEKLYEDKEKFQVHLEAAKPQIMRLISELDAESLKAILKIPEPETFKVGENELPKDAKKKLGIA
jgi:Fe-S-cluster containining protein